MARTRTVAAFISGLALCTLSVGAQAPEIQHDAIGCLVAEQYPKLRACFTPHSQVAKARIYFRREDRPVWYHVEMKSDAPCFVGTLPKPMRELVGKQVPYYVEVASQSLAVGRTAEYTPQVVRRAVECQKDPVAAYVPKAAVQVFPQMPAGFSGGGGLGLVGAAAGGAAAVTVGVLAGRGGSDPAAAPPPPGPPPVPPVPPAPPTPPPATPPPTPPGPSPSNSPPNGVFAVTPDPPAGTSPMGVRFNSCRSNDPDGDPLTFRYDFGDGQRSRGLCREEHAYAAPGNGMAEYHAEACVTDGIPGHEQCQTYVIRVTPVTVPPGSFPLTVLLAGTGTGSVGSVPAGIACQPTCAASFSAGAVVTLTAMPAAGSVFAGWSGGGCTGTGTCTVSMTAAQTVTATFTSTVPTFPLTVVKAGTGLGTVTSGEIPPAIDCGATCSADYTAGSTVVLTAQPAAGSTFSGWTGAGCTGTGTCTVLTTAAAQTVTATFTSTVPTFALTVVKAGTGTGTVTSSEVPPRIDCGATCSASYPSGTPVVLTAMPAAGSTFDGWSGAGCSGTGTCSVTMTAAQTVTATFTSTVPTFPLTVVKTGTGSGTVTSGDFPPSIDCGATCSASYPSGTPVVLTAMPAGGSTFDGWSGAGCSGTGTCPVTMTAAQTVTATFTSTAPVTFRLTVIKNGSGTGTVTSDVQPGIDCGPSCSFPFPAGTGVNLSALGDMQSTFVGWGGDCSGTGTCSLNMNTDHTVTATFNLIPPPQFTLSVSLAGSGTGQVGGSGIDCPGTCSVQLPAGSPANLSAMPGGSSTFTGWSGDCGGAGGCSLTMNGDRNVTATFELATHTLTVGIGGPGFVDTDVPGGFFCGSGTCQTQVAAGTTVRLNASPAPLPGQFDGWGSDCASFGTSNPCTIVMNADRFVTADFSPIVPSPRQPAGAAWSSDLKVPRGRGQLVVNGQLVEVGTGPQRGAFHARAGDNRLEGTLTQAAGPGTWRFDLPDGVEPGSVRAAEGRLEALAANAVVFRLAGKPGERVALVFRLAGPATIDAAPPRALPPPPPRKKR